MYGGIIVVGTKNENSVGIAQKVLKLNNTTNIFSLIFYRQSHQKKQQKNGVFPNVVLEITVLMVV